MQRARVVLDVEPVAHVGAVAVDGERLFLERVEDHQRDQLLGEVVGPVVVGAIGDDDRKPEGAEPGAGQMVGGGLGGRVGRGGIVGRLLAEGAVGPERAVDLVGGDVQEAEGLRALGRQAHPVGARGLEQAVGAQHVGADEGVRAVDRAIDMALGGEMHHRIGGMLGEHRIHGVAVADVGADEGVARAVGDGLERAQVGGVGELVDVDDVRVRLAHEIAADRRADEAGSPCDDDFHRFLRCPARPPSRLARPGLQGRCLSKGGGPRNG